MGWGRAPKSKQAERTQPAHCLETNVKGGTCHPKVTQAQEALDKSTEGKYAQGY